MGVVGAAGKGALMRSGKRWAFQPSGPLLRTSCLMRRSWACWTALFVVGRRDCWCWYRRLRLSLLLRRLTEIETVTMATRKMEMAMTRLGLKDIVTAGDQPCGGVDD